MTALKEKSFKGFMWLFGGSGFQSILKIAVFAVLARLISPSDFGVASAVTIVAGLSMAFADMGVGAAIIQRKNISDAHIKIGLLMSIALSFLLATLVALFSGAIANLFRISELERILPVVGLVFMMRGVAVVSESMLARNFEFKKIAIADLLSYLFGYALLSVFFAWLNYGYWAIVIGLLGQSFVRTVLLVVIYPVIPRLSRDVKSAVELLNFGTGNTIARFANYLANQGDQVVVSRYLGGEVLGFYGRAYQLCVMPVNIIGMSIEKVVFSGFSQIQSETERVRVGYLRAISLVSILTLPLSIAFFYASNSIVAVLLGSGWSEAVHIFQVMCLGLFFRLSNKISDSVSKSLGMVYRRALRQIIFALSVIGFSLALSPYGAGGVAFAVVISLVINFLLMILLLHSSLNFSLRAVLFSSLRGLPLAIVFSAGLLLLYLLTKSYKLSALMDLSMLLAVALTSLLITAVFIPKFTFGSDGIFLANKVLRGIGIQVRDRR